MNREARYELLPFHFAFQLSGVGCPHALFCPTVDTLYINAKETQKICGVSDALWEETFGPGAKDVKRNLKRLAGSRRFWEDGSEDLLSEFPDLEEAVLVVSSQALRIVMEEGIGYVMKIGDGEGGMLCLDDLCGDETESGQNDKGEMGRKIEMRVCAAADLERGIW